MRPQAQTATSTSVANEAFVIVGTLTNRTSTTRCNKRGTPGHQGSSLQAIGRPPDQQKLRLAASLQSRKKPLQQHSAPLTVACPNRFPPESCCKKSESTKKLGESFCPQEKNFAPDLPPAVLFGRKKNKEFGVWIQMHRHLHYCRVDDREMANAWIACYLKSWTWPPHTGSFSASFHLAASCFLVNGYFAAPPSGLPPPFAAYFRGLQSI